MMRKIVEEKVTGIIKEREITEAVKNAGPSRLVSPVPK